MSDFIRTFIAIELPQNILASIFKVQEGIRGYGFKLRWVPPQNVHLTLKFLGYISNTDVKKIGEAMVESIEGHFPIQLAAKGIGIFPGIKRPRVLWVGMIGQVDLLSKLQKNIDEKLEMVGFQPEKRTFRGHLTIARVKGKIDPGKLHDAIKQFEGFETEEFVADKIILFKSELKSSGAVYEKLMSISL
ncbi:MAG: RNA 2',3'-cyclic phosphodiesterase [Desulfobacterales bacterium]|nr:RNA 2',3'-cyclic phosphodiesterase [Desulfobacterales bacterium]